MGTDVGGAIKNFKSAVKKEDVDDAESAPDKSKEG